MPTTEIELAHSDQGTAEPALIFLPGWCGGREVFDPILAETASRRRSISIDLPSHGDNPRSKRDFDTMAIAEEVVRLLSVLGVKHVIPVSLSHAGWVALELRRRLGHVAVPAVVLLDWMPLGSPPRFTGALTALQDRATWSATRDQLFDMWGHDVDEPAVHRYIESMGTYGFDMWGRAGREIAAEFAAEPVPLAAFAALPDACPVLHLYAQPRDDDYLAAQLEFAEANPWFQVQRLDATSHFPSFEVPGDIASAIETFVETLS